MNALGDLAIAAALIVLSARAVGVRAVAAFLAAEVPLVLAYALLRDLGLPLSTSFIPGVVAAVGVAWFVVFRREMGAWLVDLGVFVMRIWRIVGTGRARLDRERWTLLAMHAVGEAASEMAAINQGALIVIERRCNLEPWARTGVPLRGDVSRELLFDIFRNRGPLHDGAVLIRLDQIVAAAALLPVAEDNLAFPQRLGFRHRAALGITQGSDAIAVVVSEETGRVSLVRRGAIARDVEKEVLIRELIDLMREPGVLQWWPGVLAPVRLLLAPVRLFGELSRSWRLRRWWRRRRWE